MNANLSNFQDLRDPKVVAEIGCNHLGDIEIAEKMIQTASEFCNVDYVKFQKRNPSELLSKEQYNNPHPNPANTYGKTYGEHREFLEFDLDTHKRLLETCKRWNVGYSCSVWDMTSAQEIASLEPDFIKIPSASNTHHEMLRFLCDSFGGDVHLSLGMTTKEEEQAIFQLFADAKRTRSLVLYHSTSGYPVPFEDLVLLEIPRLKELYASAVGGIGFSGHHLGIFADVIAYTLGAHWIERHFTLDRTWKGTDHAASLEPGGMRLVTRDLRNAKKVLTAKSQEILEIEKPQREKLKWKPAC
jgi:sialic acid synthase